MLRFTKNTTVKHELATTTGLDCWVLFLVTIWLCFKETGDKATLQKWSRGLMVVVRGGGHIEYWDSIYKVCLLIKWPRSIIDFKCG